MICKHRESDVYDSRPEDHVHSSGYQVKRAYPFITRRRRKCQSCGEKFATVEVLEHYMAAIVEELGANARLRQRAIEAVMELVNATRESLTKEDR